LFNPIEFFDLASELNQRTDHSSAIARTVVGRAYYGAFLFARETAGITVATQDSHQRTADYYLGKRRTGIGNRLNDLRTKRNDADYELKKSVGRREAGEALKIAKRIIDDLKALPQ
jgi:hypothetical protein